MQRRKKQRRANPALILLLLMLTLSVFFFNQYVAPTIPVPDQATATPTRDPEANINQAEAEFAAGNLLQSIESYQEAVLADPSNPSIYIGLARVQVLAGKFEAAETSVRCRPGPDADRLSRAVGRSYVHLPVTVGIVAK